MGKGCRLLAEPFPPAATTPLLHLVGPWRPTDSVVKPIFNAGKQEDVHGLNGVAKSLRGPPFGLACVPTTAQRPCGVEVAIGFKITTTINGASKGNAGAFILIGDSLCE